jgi:hypothetical protein
VNKQPSNFMVLYWEGWALFTFLSFMIPELLALFTGNSQNTLSAAVWRAERLVPGQPIGDWTFFHFAFTGMMILLFIWLSGHFGLGLWASGLVGGKKA